MTTSHQLILFPELRPSLRLWQGRCPVCDFASTFHVRAGRDGRPLLFCPSCQQRHALADAEARAVREESQTECRDEADAAVNRKGTQPADPDDSRRPAASDDRISRTAGGRATKVETTAGHNDSDNQICAGSRMADGTFPSPSNGDARFALLDGPTESEDDAIARLAKLSPFQYDRVREGQAKQLGVRVGVLDGQVGKSRHDAAGPASGRSVPVKDVDPWPEPVATAALLNETLDAVHRHVVLSAEAAIAVALWILHSWVYEQFAHSPRLTITSATKRCGKSTLLEVLRATCRRTLKADNVSAAGVYRIVEAYKPLCLLIDEADTFMRHNDELRGVLNSGFEQTGQVIRVVENNREQVPVAYQTYCAVALAAIGAIPGTVADRAIPVRLDRKAANQPIEKLRAVGNREKLATLERKLARWSADVGCSLSPAPTIPAGLNDREGDICVVLLAIADHAGPAWASRARDALLFVFGVRAKDEGDTELGTLLLADIRAIFRARSASRLTSGDLCKWLADIEERAWPEWRRGKPISKTQLAAALRPFRIRPTTIRDGATTAKGYYCDHFDDAWNRYLDPDSVQSLTDGDSEPSHRNIGDSDSDL
jgi:putative DNA primase/helicase